MLEILKNFYNEVSSFDLIFIFFTVLSLIKCSRKGFVLSVLAASKWLLAWVIAIYIFPKIKPYVSDVVNINEYVLDIILGLGIFIIVLFTVLMINKEIGKRITLSGLGKLDTVFGFFFGFIRGYIICVCLFTCINYVYNHKNWELNINNSKTFSWVENGSNLLIKVFPSENDYKDAKEKIEDI
jgi:membrane protein required for colicin V production